MSVSVFSVLRISIVILVFAFFAEQATESDNKYVRVFSLLLILSGVIFSYFVLEGGVF